MGQESISVGNWITTKSKSVSGGRFQIYRYTDLRHLNEQEVREINFIIKSRSHRFIAAAKEEWLYPERYVSKSQWNVFGDGYLLMPDPRPIHAGGEIFLGYFDGTVKAYDSYGRKPWQSEYKKESQNNTEANSLYRFKGEFARLYGPYRRGRTFECIELDKERDNDEFHQFHLNLEQQNKRKMRHVK